MIKIDIDEWEILINKLCTKINKEYSEWEYVYGVPRGGCLVAMEVSKRTHLKLTDKIIDMCVVVDDLIDSGRTKNKYKDYIFEVLINKQTDKKYKNEWIEFWYENTESDDNDLIVRMMERIGENPSREGLKDTPKRIINMWKEIYRGYDESKKPKIAIFENGNDGISYDQMIIDEGSYYSQCEHHMVPFFGNYWFAYIPDKKILGLSKVARIVDFYSAKLQIQERLVKEILDEIETHVKPKGIALVMKGEHLCKTMRGVKKKGNMITSDLRGVFRNGEARQEFLRLIR